MTDIEKKSYRVTLMKIIGYSLTLITCTWRLSNEVYLLRTDIASFKEFMYNQKNTNVNTANRFVKLEANGTNDRHDIDSLRFVTVAIENKIPVLRIKYYTQQRVNGRLYEHPVN